MSTTPDATASLVQHIRLPSFATQVGANPLPVLLEFWKPSCGPCRSVAPTLERLAREYDGRLVVAKLDVDAEAGSAERFDVRGLPTFVLFQRGVELARNTIVSPSALQGLVGMALASAASATGVTAAAPLRSFGGDAARKAAAVQRLQQAIDDQRLSVAATFDPAAPPECRPSTEAAGATPADFPAQLGLPWAYAELLDGLYEFAVQVGHGPVLALQWLQAIPVGVEASLALAPMARHVLYGQPAGWMGLMGLLAAQAELQPLVAGISALHLADNQDGTQDDSAWQPLRQQIERSGQSLPEPLRDHLDLLLACARPLGDIPSASLLSALWTATAQRAAAVERNWWTQAERAELAHWEALRSEQMEAVMAQAAGQMPAMDTLLQLEQQWEDQRQQQAPALVAREQALRAAQSSECLATFQHAVLPLLDLLKKLG